MAATLYEDIIVRTSVPTAILTDRGGEFTAAVMERLSERLGIARLKTSGYRPQMDAKAERAHFSVHNMITKLVGDQHTTWPQLLGPVNLAYNATVHTATGFFRMNYFILLLLVVLRMQQLKRKERNQWTTPMPMHFVQQNGYEKLSDS